MMPTVRCTLDADLETLAGMLGRDRLPGLDDARRLRLALVQVWLIRERLACGTYDRHARGSSRDSSTN